MDVKVKRGWGEGRGAQTSRMLQCKIEWLDDL